ncbi:hypothetical protein N579_03190 [Corynebacterium pseudodiphtheriticum 090104]|nr:hypothetical protein N579_03190 [Corynebacterium pseudodiphtheriticum 090104]
MFNFLQLWKYLSIEPLVTTLCTSSIIYLVAFLHHISSLVSTNTTMVGERLILIEFNESIGFDYPIIEMNNFPAAGLGFSIFEKLRDKSVQFIEFSML